MEALLLKIEGDVQGVSYRYFAKNEAKKLGLLGWAKNDHDGSVAIYIQGDTEKLDTFCDWAKEGSPMATVENVEITKSMTDETVRSFEVR